MRLSDDELDVMKALTELACTVTSPKMTTATIAAHLGWEPERAHLALEALHKNGVVAEHGNVGAAN